ncbi:hypothetical protein ABEB36_002152 [Hypothenemus hampei]|uniref:Protein AATF n=1 Tax=Hypothenemus hampei TaxID=57062 RepID=A0ABD1F4Q9_HYPHA
MSARKREETLADQIINSINHVPEEFDPEDDQIDETKAKLTDFEDLYEGDETEEAVLSKFRKQNVDLLGDIDQRYVGRKATRKQINEEEESDDESDHSHLEYTKSDESDVEESEYEDEEHLESENEVESSHTNDNEFQHMSKINVSEQINKGSCIRNQLNIWENLLEMRIQMQKILLTANKLPQKSAFQIMKMDNLEFNGRIVETQTGLSDLLNKLLQLQCLMIKKFPETKKVLLEKKQSTHEDSNEEISSEEEEEEAQSDEAIEEDRSTPKKRKLNDFEEKIANLHKSYKNYRNRTVETWNTKTRLSLTKNLGQSNSIVSQIDNILADREKLVKRTRLKRSDYKILGQKEETNETSQSEGENMVGEIKQANEYDSEIFDDTDFYHQLLRELIEVKSADITDPVQLGRQWIKLQSLRSKMKRKIDTRATKGRKIRYAVHSKLVNFMAPHDNRPISIEEAQAVYTSLFGKIQKRT